MSGILRALSAVGVVVTLALPTRAFAQAPGSSPVVAVSTPESSPFSHANLDRALVEQAPDRQQQLAHARARRQSGLVMMVAGGGLTVAGFALAKHEADNPTCTEFECTIDVRPGYLLTMGGVGTFTFGLLRFRSGAREIEALSDNTGVAQALGGENFASPRVALTLGRRPSASFRLRW